MFDTIQKSLESYNGSWKDKKGIWEFTSVIAERKAFLSTKKLTYSARIKIDDIAKKVLFSEILMEAGMGLTSGGGGFDDGMSSGFGFKTESYNTMNGARQGTIEEQSSLFGKKYDYKFNYSEIRNKVEEITKSTGYEFKYQILPVK